MGALSQSQGRWDVAPLLDLRGNIPTFIPLSDGNPHEVNVLAQMAFEAGSCSVMARGGLDFGRLHTLHRAQAFVVIRAKSNLPYRRRSSQPIDQASGLRCDHTVGLTGVPSCTESPPSLRRVKFDDAKHNTLLVRLTNHFDRPALTITKLYRCRWQGALFVTWIKQHLRIKAFLGTSENAVTTQVRIAIAVSRLVAVVKKRLKLDASLQTILQILSLTLFENTPLDQRLARIAPEEESVANGNQLNPFT
jgi:hypothetical protein